MVRSRPYFLNTRRAPSVVPALVVQKWYERPLCRNHVVHGVGGKLVMLIARYGQRDRVLGVVQIDARYAGCDPRSA